MQRHGFTPAVAVVVSPRSTAAPDAPDPNPNDHTSPAINIPPTDEALSHPLSRASEAKVQSILNPSTADGDGSDGENLGLVAEHEGGISGLLLKTQTSWLPSPGPLPPITDHPQEHLVQPPQPKTLIQQLAASLRDWGPSYSMGR